MKNMLIKLLSIIASIAIINAQSKRDEFYDLNSVEFPGIGKFNRNDFFDPLHRPVLFLPQSPIRIGVKFLLFTPTNPKNETLLHNDNQTSIQSSHFDPKLETKIIVHGFIDDLIIGGWMRRIKDEFIKRGKYNVIIVDWSTGNEPPYGQATVNTRVVGAQTANLIKDLKAVHNISFSSIHIIGHSLGSHIAGYAGQRLDKLGRITGLDPAGPFFQSTPPACRLDPTDADFVDSIHSNSHTFGMEQTVSHIDFYPNGGDNQPNCKRDELIKFITDGAIEGVKQLTSCNHQRAIDYYISSLTYSPSPIAYECKDYETFVKGKCGDCGNDNSQCARFGLGVEEWKKFRVTDKYHKMFLKTTGDPPYFLNEYIIDVRMDAINNHVNQHGSIILVIHGTNDTELVNLSEHDEILPLGTTLSYLVGLRHTIGDINSVTFKWHHSLTIFTAETYVESISVTPLFITEKAERAKSSVKLCSPDVKVPIKHDTDVEFKTKC